MKRLVAITLLVLFVLFVTSPTVFAKLLDIEVGFAIDAEFEPYVTSYNLYTEVPDSGVIALVATLGITPERSWVITAIDLIPGKITNLYLGAVYDAGVEDRSVAFPFRYTGKPVIISVIKK